MNAQPGLYRNLLTTYLGPQRRRALLLGGLLLVNICLQLAGPQILALFIDTARAGGAMQTLISLALLFLVIALVTQIVSVGETYVAEHVGLIATNQLRADLALHCLRLDPSFHSAHTPGELIERVDGDVATLGNFFSRFVVYVLGNALLLVGVLGLLFRIDWRIGLALTGFSLVTLFAVNMLRDVAVPHWEAAREAKARLFGYLEERLSGTEDIRSNGATAYVMRGLHQHSGALLRKELRAVVVGRSMGSVSLILFALGVAISFALGAYLFRAGVITLGTVYLIFNYTEMLSRPIDEITRQVQDLQQAGASVRRVHQLLGLQSSVHDGAGASLPAGPLQVDMREVSFGYEGEAPVLQDVSFCLEPGKVLGLLGRTGSGKTTLTRLLFRLYDPREGSIRVGGVDLREPALQSLRSRIGVVTQDIQLFHATVRDNLTLFDPSIPDSQIEEVLAELGLSEWLQSLPESLDTKLAPGGGGLSAGQAQSLAFARVFLRDPGLIILDEASSRLDPATEHLIERAIDKLLRSDGTRRTAIIIAHRLQTVHRADTIMILEGGRVREYGERVALVNDPESRFSGLLRTGLEEALA